MASDFTVTLAFAAGHPQAQSGAVFAIYLYFLVVGLLSVFRSLPFGLSLGIGRRSYYAGTALLAVALAAVYGLALAACRSSSGPPAGGA